MIINKIINRIIRIKLFNKKILNYNRNKDNRNKYNKNKNKSNRNKTITIKVLLKYNYHLIIHLLIFKMNKNNNKIYSVI